MASHIWAKRGRFGLPPHSTIEIASIAGPERTVVLTPDFEAAAGLHGHSHKPERAWQSFSAIEPGDIPEPLAEAVRRVLAAARD